MRDNFLGNLKWIWNSRILLLMLAFGSVLLCFVSFSGTLSLFNLTPIVPASILLFFYLRRKNNLSVSSTALGEPLVASALILNLARAEDYVDRHYGIEEVEYFLKLLTELPSYLSRVDENAQIDGRQITIKTKLVFRGTRQLLRIGRKTEDCTDAHVAPTETPTTPPADCSSSQSHRVLDNVHCQRGPTYDETLLVPLVRAKKGLLFDDFKAFGPSGAHLPTLPQWQVYGLLVVVLRTLIERAIAEARGEDVVTGKDVLSERDRYVLLHIVKNIADGVIDEGDENTLSDQLGEFDSRISHESKRRLHRFVKH